MVVPMTIMDQMAIDFGEKIIRGVKLGIWFLTPVMCNEDFDRKESLASVK